jgi:serine/threonine-protein kinase RsbW
VTRRPNRLTIPSTTLKLSRVRRFVEGHARDCGFPSDVVDQLSLAVDEACTNVIRHAYSGTKSGPVDISVDVDSDRFTITIRDEGDSIDLEKYAEPDLNKSVKKRRGGGFGVHIMRSLMDLVEYEKRGKFNVVHLTKFR